MGPGLCRGCELEAGEPYAIALARDAPLDVVRWETRDDNVVGGTLDA
jgi:hypothetical protein